MSEVSPSGSRYDAIVVGARCAGSPTAMLLARMGYKVLVVDRATFPSDTVSTFMIHPPGVSAMDRWGVLDQVVATGCPPIESYTLDIGPFAITGSPGTPESPVGYAPRRTLLDKILLDAASEAGAEIREGFVVEELTYDGDRVTGITGRDKGGMRVTETAAVVVGADGRHSLVAKSVGAESYNDKPEILAAYYSLFSGFPETDFHTYVREGRGFAAWPTNDGLTLVVGGWPYAEFEQMRRDVEGNWMGMFELVPEFAERVRAAKREERIVGAAVANYFRKPYGSGWALVGDAGYNKDFITAQGIQDAFRDAELCANALDQVFSGAAAYESAMAEYQSTRDEHVLPMYELTCQLATLEPPPPEMQQLLGAVHGNKEASDHFIRVSAGVSSPAEFFAPENVGRIFQEAAGAAAQP
ncbi:MAG TPA: NAD(P)/FAD-dependent oxidoreductase [Actinomycetota bacterium]|nr:NAD(P)/FAD-dependent oxidoreductase [Actinomycetota bacterium]